MSGRPFVYPPEQAQAREKMRRVSWISVALLLLAGVVLAFTVGSSQAMKTAWLSDVLTAIPPASLIFALRYELREPSERYPFGYLRSLSVAFLVTAAVLTVVGLYLLYDSGMKLVHGERPPIGTVVFFGRQIWAGWTMIGALAFSLAVGFTLGKLKQPLAERLHSKPLMAEARMNRAEWMSEGAAILGIVLVGFGQWWGDAAAAAFISLEIIRDGWDNIRQVVADLMDESPTRLGEHELEGLPARVRAEVEKLPWVEDAGVRMREQGHAVAGVVFVVPRADGLGAAALTERLAETRDRVRALDWRLHDVVVAPVSALERDDPPRPAAD